jgi:uncharacterized HAD superfamily protein
MSDKRPRIGIDCDGVLSDFVKGFLTLTKKHFQKPEPDIWIQNTWDFDDILTKEEVSQTWAILKSTKNWWTTLDPMPDSTDLKHLSDKEARVYFLTKRVPTIGEPVEVQTADWLSSVYGIQYPTVIVVEDQKGPLAKALELDFFLDDHWNNCLSVQKDSPETEVWLHRAVYNKDYHTGHFYTAGCFNEFLEYIRS